MDIKEISSNHGYSHILVLLCEVSNFLVALPQHSTRAQHVVEVFQRGYLAYFGPPSNIIFDLDPAFTSSLKEAFLQNLNVNMITANITNHKSLLEEHGIKSLSNLLVKHKFGCGIVFFPIQCCATILRVLPTWMVLVPMSWSLDTKWYCLMFWRLILMWWSVAYLRLSMKNFRRF